MASPSRRFALLSLALAAALAAATASTAAATPIAASGAPVALVAAGPAIPTSFAFGDSAMFAGAGPGEVGGTSDGGLFLISAGQATKIAGSPRYVYGLAWHYGRLYVSAGRTIVVMGGWNGTAFARHRTIYDGGAKFNGFSGIAFGPDGRLYAGLLAKEPKYDHAKDPYWLSQGLVSMTASGKELRFVARGLRQPFQMVFPAGSRWPYVSDLGQDLGTNIPPDEIVHAEPGQNYGFPSCTWLVLSACGHYTKPLVLLPAHTSPMGIGALGANLYVAFYTGLPGIGSEVAAIPIAGGAPTMVMVGFSASIIALSIHAGTLYVGQQDGTIYSVKL